MQENILLEQKDLQQNKEIRKNSLDLTANFDSLVKKTEELSSQMLAAQNTSKELQEAYQKTNERLTELKRQQQT